MSKVEVFMPIGGGLPAYADLPEAASGGRSAWHVFGELDSLGSMNLQTEERVRRAAGLVVTGQVFSLNAAVDFPDPPLFGRGQVRRTEFDNPLGLDDVLDNFFLQGSSQWDSLAHVSSTAGAYWGGVSRERMVAARRNTIDHLARKGVAGRGVVLDVAGVAEAQGWGFDPAMAHSITVDELRRVLDAQGVGCQEGDVLLVNTGWLDWYRRQATAVRGRLSRGGFKTPGLEHSEEMAAFLWDAHAAAVVADNPSLEVFPPDIVPEHAPFGFLHRALISQLGLWIGELWWLADLVDACRADGRYECFVTSAPLNVPGGIGSPANALAIR